MEAEIRPPLPIFPFFLCFQTGLACLLALSPPKPSKIAGCSALTSFVALTYLCSTGDAARDYGVGNLIMIQAVTAYLLLWLVNPLCDYRHESDYTDPAKYPFLRRFWWMFSIINNPRGVGWSYEVTVTVRRIVYEALILLFTLGRTSSAETQLLQVGLRRPQGDMRLPVVHLPRYCPVLQPVSMAAHG